MSYEQLDFLDPEDKEKFLEQEEETKKEKKEDDGLGFNCEVCQDQGCSECGWGKDYK